MPDVQFDAYLALLTRFLRLSPRQREDIRRELRAHLEEAVEEEIKRGVSREEAILRALDDFGDAAELAARFSSVGRKQRWIMRGSLAAACIGIGVLLFNVLTPQTAPVAVASLQRPGDIQPAPAAAVAPAAGADAKDRLIEAALAREVADVSFKDVPLENVLDWFQDLLAVNLHVRWREIEDAGVSRDAPVSLKLKNVPAERALRLALEEGGNDIELSYEIDDGVLVVAAGQRWVTRVYDVRDLLGAKGSPQGVVHPLRPPVAGEDADEEADEEQDENSAADQTHTHELEDDHPLIELINTTIEPDSWQVNGGAGTQRLYNHALVVRQTSGVHRQIDRLLRDLRGAGGVLPLAAPPPLGAAPRPESLAPAQPPVLAPRAQAESPAAP